MIHSARRPPGSLWLALMLVLLHGGRPSRGEGLVADIGGRLELFVDDRHVESMDRVRLLLHHPRRAEVALRFDEPWEGPDSGFVTVFRDENRYRMYYRGWPDPDGDQMTCYAESLDGITWDKPSLGLVAFNDSTENNIILRMPGKEGTHNFTPFRDDRPGVPDDERYKALGGQPPYAFASADGIRWRRLQPDPVLTQGAFDSQNVAYWDLVRRVYVSYFRVLRDGVRSIATATSDDFLNWSDPIPVEIGDGPVEHLDTNAATPYFRAPHYTLFFPNRFVPDRKRLGSHPERGISDAVFFCSRNGVHLDRTFGEAFIRPGRDPLNWGDRSTMPARGLVPTGRDEMSIYYSQHDGFPTAHLRRGVLRIDGIASAHADGAEGELVTTPIRFTGRWLVLNYATSAAGSIRVEIQDPKGRPIPGFTLEEASPAFGDELAEAYSWAEGPDVSALAGQPVRLRFVMTDADLYSYRFAE